MAVIFDGSLKDLIALMTDGRVQRVEVDGAKVELSPDAWAPKSLQPVASKDTDRCGCSHSIDVQHNEHGECLLGCSPEICSKSAGAVDG